MKSDKFQNFESLNFYSDGMIISKSLLSTHHLKLTYQRNLISNLDSKHKNWSKYIGY